MRNCDIEFLADLAAALLAGRTIRSGEADRLKEIALAEQRAKCWYCAATPPTPHVGCPFTRERRVECDGCKTVLPNCYTRPEIL